MYLRNILRNHLEYLVKYINVEQYTLSSLRGSTIQNAWLLTSEMQNATQKQMMMLLSRIVENSKFVSNGDPCQIDLAYDLSGLQKHTAYVFNRLRALTSFHFVKTISYIPDNVGTR